ncbi:MAG: NAD(P)-binding domain-containing protein [Chitinivibrionales bacterium]|nr:NAD(P)-binding domain-containing protein [Chitinivibrionales bacterium]
MSGGAFYFSWLQRDNPTIVPDRFPALINDFETSLPSVYCIGDLTGIPLIRNAAESGFELIKRFENDTLYQSQRQQKQEGVLDLIIIGGGPAGVAACLASGECGYSHVLIESAQLFHTITSYPAGKPITVTPAQPPMRSGLVFSDGTKETLLRQLHHSLADKNLPVRLAETASRIFRRDGNCVVETDRDSYTALRVVIAIGKTGTSRLLDVPGEKSSKVYHRLIDPRVFKNCDLLVVGGGDSAVEAAVALARAGNQVTLSYRQPMLSRPKPANRADFEELVGKGKIKPMFNSSVREIRPDEVVIADGRGLHTVANDAVFVLIGTRIPVDFFRRSNIRLEGDRRPADWMAFFTMLMFAALLYFGKKAPVTPIPDFLSFFTLPWHLYDLGWSAYWYGIGAWAGMLLLPLGVAGMVILHFRNQNVSGQSRWNSFKYGYFFSAMLLFAILYIHYKLRSSTMMLADMGDWYTIVYSMTIVIFGIRRIARRPTGYITRQTWTLIAVQLIALCILPLFLIPLAGRNDLIAGWMKSAVFPADSYWRSYGFILAWPLFIYNLVTTTPTMFWLCYSAFQTFVVIPLIVYRWGKGAYCGWICSCGGLAETLGDEYRSRAPHGPAAKRLENAGQIVLWCAVAVTGLHLAAVRWSGGGAVAALLSSLYGLIVDCVLAGVIGLGLYSAISGRVWCRFFCPLAALMHIYARFTRFRIFSDKKRCISCSICTKVCHMGIDVMSYANKGIPMNDVQCVRCSTCIVNCPMQVLTFGSQDRADVANMNYLKREYPRAPYWHNGLTAADSDMLVHCERVES